MNHHAKQATYKNSLNLSGAFIRRTNLSGVNLSGADLSGADCSFVNFSGANFKDALLKKTILRGADLREVVNLTHEQISEAVYDQATILPDYLQ